MCGSCMLESRIVLRRAATGRGEDDDGVAYAMPGHRGVMDGKNASSKAAQASAPAAVVIKVKGRFAADE